MQKLLEHYTIHPHKALYAKDPVSSDVGKEILRESTILLAKEGLESFTFKKLAMAMSSTETTIYRYFQNKQQLVMYLSSWYWLTMEWKIVFATANIKEARERLDRVTQVLSNDLEVEQAQTLLNEELLQTIVIRDAFKVFDFASNDEELQSGYFSAYNELCERIALIIKECNKTYKYPKALASTIVDSAMRQQYFRNAIPHVSDAAQSAKSTHHFLNSILSNIL